MMNLTMANLTMMINEVIKYVAMFVNVLVRIGVSLGFTPSEVRLFLIIALAVNVGIRSAHQNAIFARRLRVKQRKISKSIYDTLGDMSNMCREQSYKEEYKGEATNANA